MEGVEGGNLEFNLGPVFYQNTVGAGIAIPRAVLKLS